MALGDKIENAKDKLVGQVKETVGKATDDESLEAEGRADKAKGGLKQAGENVKDALS